MTVDEFRTAIITQAFDEVLTDILLSDDAVHISIDNKEHIVKSIASKYQVSIEEVKLIIVGSAKLGFSISEKKKAGVLYPRYRAFRPESDVDIAVISPIIYEKIWNELSTFIFNQHWIPWDTGNLGDYMTAGWMRPDLFPRGRRLRRCDDWWDIFRKLSSQQTLGRRQIRGGLFFNFEQLKNYQARALRECILSEKSRI